ncbi:MAG: Thiol-disulfide oxidoreductase [uncultured Sulfurovum sp.]|uniref:Thiol-disulfide oxidoreductase n=1 Tax=uncultured Sulfurovum sp. TaxID=269237 RepID=A0A6S6TFJ9_9BACT|nr:MAG: Thiol-disulfide oxidoreductase [uncultured Sulfurovum sp.]
MMQKNKEIKNKYDNHNIVLFDGVCNLCESSIQFIIKHDDKQHFHFVSQTSELGEYLLDKYALESIDSIAYISNQKAYIYSDAALEIAKNLEGWYRHLTFFRFLPRIFRDGVYKLVAKYRYKVFGKKKSCMMPSLELKSRFLD